MDSRPTYRVIHRADLGNVIARADFLEQTIELNDSVYPYLSPMMQELVMCHEVCHLAYGEHDENRTRQLGEELFLSRATSPDDLKRRRAAIGKDDAGRYGNELLLILTIVSAALTITAAAATYFVKRNQGWYMWNDTTRKARMRTMLDAAFRNAKASGKRTPADFLWEQLNVYTAKDNSLDQFLDRNKNSWVEGMIQEYETAYGFGFNETYKRPLAEKPWFKAVAVVVVGLAVYLAVDAVRK